MLILQFKTWQNAVCFSNWCTVIKGYKCSYSLLLLHCHICVLQSWITSKLRVWRISLPAFETHKHSRMCFNLLVSCTTDPRISKICVIRYAPQSIGICTSQSFVLRNLLGLVSINIAVFSPSFYWKLLIETKNAAHSEEKLVSGNKSFRIVNPKCCVKLSLPVYSRG